MELAHFGIQTVEQLSEVPDTRIQNIGLYQKLKRQARELITQMKGNAPFEKIQAELDAKNNQLEAMQSQLAMLMAERNEKEEKPASKKSAKAALKAAESEG
jgi:hypothetical protein